MLMSLEDKIDEIYNVCTEIKVQNAECMKDHSQTRKELDYHEEVIKELKSFKDNLIGKLVVFSMLGGAVFTWIGYLIQKHF